MSDAVKRYRYRRSKRTGTLGRTEFDDNPTVLYYERRYNRSRARFDDDEDGENNNGGRKGGGGNGGGHGNTRIPFGLCHREGIPIEEGWTPKDAWDALKGKGYNPGEVYRELRKTGKVPASKPEETVKPSPEVKELGKKVADMTKKKKRLEKLNKERDKVKKEYETAKYEMESSQMAIAKSKARMKELVNKYGSVENIPRETADGKPASYFNPTPYMDYMRDEATVERETSTLGRVEKEFNENGEKLKSVNRKIQELGYDDNEYEQAKTSLLEKSPYTEKVKDYRAAEERLDTKKSQLKATEGRIESCKINAEFYEKRAKEERDRGNAERAEYFEKYLASTKKRLEDSQKAAEELKSDIAKRENAMKDAKGDAEDEEWNQIHDLAIDRDTVHEMKYEQFSDFARSMRKVKYNPPVKLAGERTEEEIIDDIRGGDKTGGSCASCAFAYFFSKAGYDIRDFRGGESKERFSTGCETIIAKCGGYRETDYNSVEAAKKVLSTVEEGKEYYFVGGKHAAVVKRVGGNLQFLELQDGTSGWCDLTDAQLKKRFGATKTRTHYGRKVEQQAYIIEGSKLAENKELLSLMGYLNTAVDKQKKGKDGRLY